MNGFMKKKLFAMSLSKGVIILRSKIFWKFYFAFLFLLFVSLFSSYLYLRSHLLESNVHETSQALDQMINLIMKSLEEQKNQYWNSDNLQVQVNHLAQGADYRITVIDRRGKVLADSEVSAAKLVEMENHANRPEVKEALEKGWGQSQRYSTSLQKDMLYVARPFQEGVIRVAMPLTSLVQSLNQLKSILFYGLFWGGLFSALLSVWVARRFSKPLRALRFAAEQMTQGNFERRVKVKGKDELADLSKSFNELSSILGDLVQKLSEEKKQLRTTLDSMVEGVIVLNAAGKIILSNPAFRSMFEFNYPPENYTPIELFRNSDLQAIVDSVIHGKECKNYEIEIQREGSQYFMVQGAPFLSDQGVEGSVLVFYDITSLRRLEKVRKDFVANVSHELKTPLTAIKGYAETLLSGALQDKENAPKFLKIIDQNADRLNRIVSDLLDLSKIESTQHKIFLEKTELISFFEEIKMTFEKSLSEKQISFSVELGKVKYALVDPGAFRQILNNLIDNAIKYSERGGKVQVCVKEDDRNLLFEVHDSGSGIPPEHLSRIFERFYRVDPSRSRAQGGTGLGLSIVKHLVQLHGGEIWAESEMGKGSTFSFTIPQTGIV